MSRRVKIESHYLRAKFGHGIDYGYTSVPNILLDHALELNLDDNLVFFIVKIIRTQDELRTLKKKFITDTDLKMSCSSRTLQRYRRQLEKIKDEAGNRLVEIKSFYTNDDKGHLIGAGTDYNFKPLIDYILKKYYPDEPTGQNVSSGNEPTGQKELPDGQIVVSDTEIVTPDDKMSDINNIELIESLENKNTQKNNYIDVLTSGDTTYYFYPDNIYLCKGNRKGRTMSPKQVYNELPLNHPVNKRIEEIYTA